MIRSIGFVIVFLSFISSVMARECDSLKVSAPSAWFPFLYTDVRTQKFVGLSIEMSRLIANDLQLPLIFESDLPWTRTVKYFDEGKLDIIASLYWTKERAHQKSYLYTEPYFKNEIRVFVAKGKEFTLDTVEDLSGKVGGRPIEGSFGEEFEQAAKQNNLEFDYLGHYKDEEAGETIVNKTLLGRTDYYLEDFIDGSAYLNDQALHNKITILPNPVAITDVHMVISPKSPCREHFAKINAIIQSMQQDGRLQAMINKYQEMSGIAIPN